MLYSELAATYEKLSETRKTLEKTTILSDFLGKLKKEKNKNIIYLLKGRIFPDYNEKEIGISIQLTIKALAKSSGHSETEIVKRFKELGDLGKVAEQIIEKKKQHTLSSSKLTCEKVLENLRKLTEFQGKGTVEKKLALISELYNSCSSIEAKYLTRTLLSDLRIGIGEGVLRNAIVESCLNQEDEDYKLVQEAYDKSNDLALVFQEACKGKHALKNVDISLDKPLKVMLYPKAKDIDDAFEIVGKKAAFEFKYDGFRCITGNTFIYTKSRGVLAVKDIKVGYEVLTHKGRFKKVIALNKRVISKAERLYRIQSFLGNEFKVTEKHPILTYKDSKFKWESAENIKKSDELAFPLNKMNVINSFKNKLELIDASGYKKTIPINRFFFRFLGYWIGDGFTNDYHNTERIGIIFNEKKEKRLCSYYKRNLKKYFKLTHISESTHNGAVYLYWRDKPLRIWLSEHFRREWKGKMIPDWFFGISKKQFEEFLKGWIESDGYRDDFGRTSITTKERDMAMISQLLALKFKKVIGIKKLMIEHKDYYRLIIPKTDKHFRIKDNYILLKILKCEEIKNRDPRINLYNLQVEHDESYCTTMAILHNCLIHKDKKGIKIFTRRLDNVTNQFPDVVKYVLENVKADSFILDSEAVGYNPKTKAYQPFQAISQRIKRKYDIEKLEKELPIEINIFDILYYNNKNLLNTGFIERRKILEKIVKSKPYKIRLAEQIITDSREKAEKFYQQALKAGQEGIMAKKLDAPYKPGSRIGYGVKIKPDSNDFDLVIVKAEFGTGKRAGWLTSYTVACRDKGKLLEVGKVSTGLKEKEEQGLSFLELSKKLKPLIISEKGREVTVKPKLVVTVKYQNIQVSPTYESGFAFRFPRISALRPDRSENDIATLEEIKKEHNKAKDAYTFG